MKRQAGTYSVIAFAFTLLLIPKQDFAQVTVQVDAALSRKLISPYIYGKNNSLSDSPSKPLIKSQWQLNREAGIRIMREGGGNNSTKYNWRLKLSSHPDWYNNVYAHDWDFAAKSLQDNLPGVQGLWSFQLIGRAAKTNSYNFGDWNYNRSQWWTGVNQNLAGGGTVNPSGGNKALVEGNPNLYLMDWPPDSTVKILEKWFGANGLGLDKNQFRYWNMDNEPEIWSGTHDDVMSAQLPVDEFMQRYFQVVKKARQLFPQIKIAGPLPANEWQWYNWNNGRISYNGKDYVWLEYFIKRIADEQKSSGIRLLDVLDIHFYPGETASNDILQLHRVYFDKNYNYPGANGVRRLGTTGWDTSITKEYILERCSEWLAKYIGPDHGVSFGITETDVQTSDQNVVAVWYASTLGEFMKQNVEIFTPWTWKPGMYEVIHLFSRYNHNISIHSTSSDETYVSAYSSLSLKEDSLTVVLVNRSVNESKDVKINIANFPVPDREFNFLRLNNIPPDETFNSHQENALKKGIVSASNNSLNLQLPPLSVTSVLFKSKLSGILMPDIRKDMNLILHPIPAKDILNVTFFPGISCLLKILIIDTCGRIQLEKEVSSSQSEKFSVQVDIRFLENGMYLLKAEAGNQTIKNKFVINR